jgi:uncharacterized lipoprotein YmbA
MGKEKQNEAHRISKDSHISGSVYHALAYWMWQQQSKSRILHLKSPYRDRPQIVTRSGPNKLNIDEFHRWAGPLDARFARVLAENIALLLATDRVAVYPWEIDFKPHYRIALDIRYFEGQLGENVLLDVVWRVSGQDSQMIQAVKTSVIKEPVSAPDYDALVAAKSEAIAQLSRDITQEIRKLQAGGQTD